MAVLTTPHNHPSLVFETSPSNNHYFATHNLFTASAPLQGHCLYVLSRFLFNLLFNQHSTSSSSYPPSHSHSSFRRVALFHTVCRQLCLGSEATNTPSRQCTI